MIEKILICLNNNISFDLVCKGCSKIENKIEKNQYFCSIYRDFKDIKCDSLEKVGGSGVCFYKK